MVKILEKIKKAKEAFKPQKVDKQPVVEEIEYEGIFKDRFEKAKKKTKKEEYVRMTLNYKIVSALTYFNIGVLFPVAFLNWLLTLLGFLDFALLNFIPWYIFIPLWILPYLTWQYSTITVPQKKGHVIVGDFSKTPKGRKRAALFNLIPFYVMGWSAAGKWVYENYLVFLVNFRLREPYTGYLLTDDLDSFVLILFVAPVIVTGLALFVQFRDYMINKDLLETHFMKWEAPYIKKYAHEYRLESCDVIVGFEFDSKKPIIIKEDARFLHEAIIGATGSGKTSTTLLLRIAQDLVKLASGVRDCGVVFLEPKGDGIDDVLTICKKLGIPDSKIMVIDPTKSWSMKYNPFDGNRDAAAASFQGTLSALAGDQDQFFKDQQNEAANMYALLAKVRFGNKTNIMHIQMMFSDPRYLATVVEEVRKLIESNLERDDLDTHMRNELDSYERIVSYFENDVLDYKTYRDREDILPVFYPEGHKYQGLQMVDNKKDKFITGAKKYLNDIAQNTLLQSLFVSENGEVPFNADEFLKQGGVVLINTALGELDELSLMFGQFFIRNFQSAVFRRAKEDKEVGVSRIPIFFYVDEFPLYANEAFERFLTLGRSFKVGSIIAMQSIAQLESVGLAYRKAVMGNASHKTVFGRGPVEDNEYFSKEFGEELIVEESQNESGTPMTNDTQSWGYRLNTQKKLAPRFIPTAIRELPFKEMIVQVVNERNSIEPPKHAIGQFVHESPFVKRFMDLVESDIKSTNEKELVIGNHISDETINSFTRNVKNDYEKKASSPAIGEGEYTEQDVSEEVSSTLNGTYQQNNVITTPDTPASSTKLEEAADYIETPNESIHEKAEMPNNQEDEWVQRLLINEKDTSNANQSEPIATISSTNTSVDFNNSGQGSLNLEIPEFEPDMNAITPTVLDNEPPIVATPSAIPIVNNEVVSSDEPTIGDKSVENEHEPTAMIETENLSNFEYEPITVPPIPDTEPVDAFIIPSMVTGDYSDNVDFDIDFGGLESDNAFATNEFVNQISDTSNSLSDEFKNVEGEQEPVQLISDTAFETSSPPSVEQLEELMQIIHNVQPINNEPANSADNQAVRGNGKEHTLKRTEKKIPVKKSVDEDVEIDDL